MELFGIAVELLGFLFIAAFTAGFIDTLAGGGGLISLPAIILAGIPPLFALGTNKLQGSMGTLTATVVMLKNKRAKWEQVRVLMLAAFIGSLLGTVAVQMINTEILDFVIPMVLFCMAVYFLFSSKVQSSGGSPKISRQVYRNIVVPVIGWYDGMFGPGTGTFFVLAGVSLRGQGLIDATVVAKTLNFATNIASLGVFLMAGKVVWIIGLVMMAGQMAGAWAGSHCLFKINPRWLRLIVVVMCTGMLIKYAFSKGWLG